MGLISNGSTVFDAGAMSAGFGGSMTFIKKLTASSSGTLSFVHGSSSVVLDDTYKEYLFTFKDIHPATNGAELQFNISVDTGSNYNIAKTTATFLAYHSGTTDSNTGLVYDGNFDLAQGTGFQNIAFNIGNGNSECAAGTLQLFNPSDTTFAKHFICNTSVYEADDRNFNCFTAGYGNTTSAVDAIQFKMHSGNIDAGDICLYGIS